MKTPDAQQLDPVIPATWPAMNVERVGSVTLRAGGGGQRATAATVDGAFSKPDVIAAEIAMQSRSECLFRIRPGEEELAQFLETRGYVRRDPTNMLVMAIDGLAACELKPVSAFQIWPPLRIMNEIWEQSDVGPDRRANMARVEGSKTGLFGRGLDKPAGVGFAAIHDDIAMIHAVAVLPGIRRQKVAENMMIASAKWAQDLGAKWLATLCTQENEIANSLYQSLGMTSVGSYYYMAKGNREN